MRLAQAGNITNSGTAIQHVVQKPVDPFGVRVARVQSSKQMAVILSHRGPLQGPLSSSKMMHEFDAMLRST
jgi:hypothetical protein